MYSTHHKRNANCTSDNKSTRINDRRESKLDTHEATTQQWQRFRVPVGLFEFATSPTGLRSTATSLAFCGLGVCAKSHLHKVDELVLKSSCKTMCSFFQNYSCQNLSIFFSCNKIVSNDISCNDNTSVFPAMVVTSAAVQRTCRVLGRYLPPKPPYR